MNRSGWVESHTCWICGDQLTITAQSSAAAEDALRDLGWQGTYGILWCASCEALRVSGKLGGHPDFGHRTEFREDDSVWCYDCKGVVAVADG